MVKQIEYDIVVLEAKYWRAQCILAANGELKLEHIPSKILLLFCRPPDHDEVEKLIQRAGEIMVEKKLMVE